MLLADITPLVLTFNEAPNIRRTLAALDWAGEVVVVDSYSTDGTPEIAGAFDNVRVVQRAFDTHMQQWNFGLHDTGIRTCWVLSLDADHIVEPPLRDAIAALDASAVAGYWIPFEYRFLGAHLGRTLYPPVLGLYRREGSRYIQEGHAQRVRVDGATRHLDVCMTHDDRKSLSRWLWSQQRYAQLEARWLAACAPASLTRTHRLRRLGFVLPWLGPLVYLLWRGGLWKGRAGWAYALQRMIAESLIALNLLFQKSGAAVEDDVSEVTAVAKQQPVDTERPGA